MNNSIEDFQDRLTEISWHEGVAFGRVHLIFKEEKKYSQEILKLQGYLTLSDAFKSFYLETVDNVSFTIAAKRNKSLPEEYPVLLARLKHNFSDLCAAERLAINGYPLQAYSILRNTFDNILLTSAVLQGHTDYLSIEGIVSGENFDPHKAKKLRKNVSFKVIDVMMGKHSGFEQDVIEELSKWDDLFDLEVHGGRLTFSGIRGWLKGEESLAILPKYKELDFALFVNRFCEISWMLHKLIPKLQVFENYDQRWAEKWRIIDESFEATIAALTLELGKKIGGVMVTFIKEKFPYDENSLF